MKTRNQLHSLRLFALLAFILLFGTGGTDSLMKLAAEFGCEECEKEQAIIVTPASIPTWHGRRKRVQGLSVSLDPADWALGNPVPLNPFFTLEVSILEPSKGVAIIEILTFFDLKLGPRTIVGFLNPATFRVEAIFEDSTSGPETAFFQVRPLFPTIVPETFSLSEGPPEEIRFKVTNVENPERCTLTDLGPPPSASQFINVVELSKDVEEWALTLQTVCTPPQRCSNYTFVRLRLEDCVPEPLEVLVLLNLFCHSLDPPDEDACSDL